MSKLLEQINTSNKKLFQLKDLFEIGPQYGYTESASKKEIGPRFLRITDIQGNVVDWSTVPYCKISEIEKTKYLLKKNDLVFARTGATTGMSYFMISDLLEDAVFASYLIRLRFNENICSPELLKFFFQSRNYWGQVNGSLSGSAQPGINAVTLSEMEVQLPTDVLIQKKIAEILSVYDSKIENNNKIIKNLEEIAQTIFNEWFVNFKFPGWEKVKMVDSEMGEIPEGWIIKPLDEVANFLNGVASQKYPAENLKYSLPVIKIREMNSGIDNNSDRATKNIEQKYIIKNGDILFAWSGSLSLMVWVGGKGVLNQHIFKVTSEKYPRWFIYYCIKKHLQNFKMIAEGKATTMGHIQRHHLTDSLVLIPDEYVFTKANKILDPLFNQQIKFMEENISLKSQRDLLLAKLI